MSISSHFKRLSNGKFTLKESAPEKLNELIMDIHHEIGRSLPNDIIYDAIYEAICDIEGGYDTESDLYNSDLIDWLSNLNMSLHYCEQAREEGLISVDATLMERIQAGQYLFKTEIRNMIENNRDFKEME